MLRAHVGVPSVFDIVVLAINTSAESVRVNIDVNYCAASLGLGRDLRLVDLSSLVLQVHLVLLGAS